MIISLFKVLIYTTLDKVNEETLIHTEKRSPSVNMLELHHFHLHHGDMVRVNVTATNNAELSSSASSDGFTVDLTKPKMLLLVDGDNPQHDLQYTVSRKVDMIVDLWGFYVGKCSSVYCEIVFKLRICLV